MDTRYTSEEQEIIKQFEEGRQLRDTTNTPGWQLVLDRMEARVIKAEYQLMNYDGTDREALVALHRRARTLREFFQELQREINSSIDAALQTPSTLARRTQPSSDPEAW